MRVAEALSERSDASRRVAQLRSRIARNARYQEGEEPAEDAAELLAEAERVLARLEELIRRINRTNAASRIDGEETVTDALARRDVLRLRHGILASAADAAAGGDEHGFVRQLRSELKMFSALPVSELRAQADAVAQEIRELDSRIQRTNWEVELLD